MSEGIRHRAFLVARAKAEADAKKKAQELAKAKIALAKEKKEKQVAWTISRSSVKRRNQRNKARA